MKTTVINLYGGPGCGKSTLAAELFYRLKRMGFAVELVREYVKDWAWENRRITSFDQPYILGQQIHRESVLYGKVDFIVTDSPILLSPFYQKKYSGSEYTSAVVQGHLDLARKNGIEHRHFFLRRNKPYDSRGRYENEIEAQQIDTELHAYMCEILLGNFPDITCTDEHKAEVILNLVELPTI